MAAIHISDTAERSQIRQRSLQQVTGEIIVHPVTLIIAEQAGRLDGLLAAQGKRTARIDLRIAATALELGSAVVTANVRHFERVPGLQLMKL